MTNTPSNKDAFIIIGIDEENDYIPLSVENSPNRRNTQQIVYFLRTKHFVGVYRPIVSVESISIDCSIVNIIVIHNSVHTPFYLTENYKNINANNIYRRVMDSNIPKNASANISLIENLWEKRFWVTCISTGKNTNVFISYTVMELLP